MLGETAAALQDFRDCLALAPEFVNAYYDRGVLLVNENRIHEAIEDYSERSNATRNSRIAISRRGEAYTQLGDPKQRLQDFNVAVELDPENPDAYYYRSIAYKQLGDNRSATARSEHRATSVR